jgi:hypothetical protein
VDESSIQYHTVLSQSKFAWQSQEQDLHKRLAVASLKGITLYGAIGACLKRPVIIKGNSTNQETFLEFAQLVV